MVLSLSLSSVFLRFLPCCFFFFFFFFSALSLLFSSISVRLPSLLSFQFFFSSSPVFIGERQGGGRHGGGRCAATRSTPVQHVETGRQVVSLFRRLFEQKKERN